MKYIYNFLFKNNNHNRRGPRLIFKNYIFITHSRDECIYIGETEKQPVLIKIF